MAGATIGGMSLQIAHIDSVENVAVSSGAAAATTQVPTQGAIMITCSVDTYVLTGAAPAPDSSTGFYLTAGQILVLQVNKAERVGGRAVSTSGIMSVAYLS